MDFDATCALAARLLAQNDVGRWLAAAYPIVMVDECQDCSDVHLALVERLGDAAKLFVAADEFQNLDGVVSPAMKWIEESTDRVELVAVHRTNQQGLLTAAAKIRALEALPVAWGKQGFSLVGVKNPYVAAKYLVQNICWKGGDFVVLAPTSPSASRFVRETLARAGREPAFVDKHGRAFKLCPVGWEMGSEQAVKTLEAAYHDGSYRKPSPELPTCAGGWDGRGESEGEHHSRSRRSRPPLGALCSIIAPITGPQGVSAV